MTVFDRSVPVQLIACEHKEIGPHLLELYDRYMARQSRAMTSVTLSGAVAIIIVLGAESPDHVIETLRSGSDELVSRTVKSYLSERFSD